VDVKQVAMFPAGDGSRRTAHDSFQQPFQELTRALAGAARAGGARVVLDGHGGDFLFQVSRAYLGDLVARGNVMRAWHEWRAIDRGREGARGFIRSAIQPALPGAALRAASVALGRPVLGPMERPTPPWIEAGFTAAHDIEARQRALGADAQPGRTASERETRFCLTHPFFARVNAAMAEHALEYGVELRSPLLARRVVEFALTRPREERNHAGDQKRLLRAAMRGLLPESVLAPRPRKQGTLATYFAYNMTTAGLAALRRTMPLVALADHGVVNPRAFSKAVERFAAEGPAYPHIEALYCTLQAELWLRAHEGSVPAQTIDTARMQAVPALFSHGGDTAPHLRRAGSPATLLETE
jgi:asparagine synthetase B (glutamine-hydrolysing)